MTRQSFPAEWKFFGTYAKALSHIPERSKRAELALALIEYASWGEEPTFDEADWALEATFETMRVNIDNSVQHYIDSKKGGRPRKRQTTFDPEVGSQMAKAAEICQEEPVPDEVLEAEAAYMSDEWERKRDLLREEIEASEWIG